MKLLRPITVSDAELTSSTVAEADAPAYNAATTYAKEAKVLYQHRVYESLVDGNVGNTPVVALDKWLDTGPSNRWAMFDRAVGTLTKTGASITVVMKAGLIDALAFLETQAASAVVKLVNGTTTVFDKTVSFEAGGKAITDWYMYFTAPAGRVKSLVVEDIPMYGDATLTVTLTHESAVECGALLLGSMYPLGDTQSKGQLGFVDYSRKETNSFGATDFIERSWAKKATLQVVIPTSSVDEILSELVRVRARPVLYLGDKRLDWLRIYGIARRVEVTVEYIDFSYLSLELEGLI